MRMDFLPETLTQLGERRIVRRVRLRLTQPWEGALAPVGENIVIRKGGFLNRAFDSRFADLGRNKVSGPFGRSFSPGSGIPTTAGETIRDRGPQLLLPEQCRRSKHF